MWTRKWTLRAEADEAEGSSTVSDEADSKLWDDLLNDDEPVETKGEAFTEEKAEEVGGEAETEAEAPAVEAEPEAKPAVESVIVEEQPKVEAPQAAQPQVSTPPPAAPATDQAVQQPWQVTDEQRAEWRKQAFDGLAQRYALSEEDSSALQVEPEKVLPRIAANLHMQVYEDVVRHIAQEAPNLVGQILQQQEQTRQAEDAFYAKWGDLRQHREKVTQVARMWRQMYPNATLDEAIDGVGQATMALLGVQPQAVAAAAATPPPPPAPARPAARAPVRTVQSKLSAEEQAFADLAKSFEEEF